MQGSASLNESIVNMLWIGESLGSIEILSLNSWLATGHAVRLHTYGPVRNVPNGVEIADGRETAPFERIQRLRHTNSGSFALASDYFRYQLQCNGAGLWSDLDVVCLKPVLVNSDYIFGFEDEKMINGAVLYLKRGTPVAEDLVGLFKDNLIPPWTRRSRARKLKLKRLFGMRFTPAELPWGTYGPQALTATARRHGIYDMARPTDEFYPLHYRDARRIFDRSFSLDNVITDRTKTLHLWNEALGNIKNDPAPVGSPLAKLMDRFNV